MVKTNLWCEPMVLSVGRARMLDWKLRVTAMPVDPGMEISGRLLRVVRWKAQ